VRYHALACDYDGTLATHGRIDAATTAALGRLRASGRKLLMVTGRQVEDLIAVCPEIDLFDLVVAENGAVVYVPETRSSRALADPPPPAFLSALRARGVDPLSVGQVIVATWRPHETATLEVIRNLGLELQVIFNKGAVMILPSGVNKATGLAAALSELGLSTHNVVAVGDAENDHAFLSACECAVAVANALPTLKERADVVTTGDHGAGVTEIVDGLLASDLRDVSPRLSRHDIPLGAGAQGEPVLLPAYGVTVLLAGSSGGGKSTFATGIIERLAERGYQHCIIDPEGDHADYQDAVVLGDAHHAPALSEVCELVGKQRQNAVVNLLALPLDDRPRFFETLFPRLQELRAHTGRPHWVVLDEIHHLLPAAWDPATLTVAQELHGLILITVHPDKVSSAILSKVDLILVVGGAPDQTMRSFADALGEPAPPLPELPLQPGDAIVWWRRRHQAPFWLRGISPRREHRRHVRKYMEGELGPDKSFYFRGAEGRLNLRAQNLTLFLQVADGVDDGTWLHHLAQGDYSSWLREAIKDDRLADEVAAIEGRPDPSPRDTRAEVRAAIERRYTASA
jgi:hydroxymethylpyrimidine pyrophosphatase-like HAD family hydrolase